MRLSSPKSILDNGAYPVQQEERTDAKESVNGQQWLERIDVEESHQDE
jgi:hypothetical protein